MSNYTLKQRRANFYQDPERPGQARHQQCLARAGINPVKLGYPISEGPCWVCESIAEEHRSFLKLIARVQNQREIAGHLKHLCLMSFRLAKAVRCATGMGRVPRHILEMEHEKDLSTFRRALVTAKERAQDPGGNGTSWHRAEEPPESGTYRHPGPYLNSDPTAREYVSIIEIEHKAGILSVLSRIFQADADCHAAKGRTLYGKDPEELLMTRINQLKASPLALAEVVVSVARPVTRLTDPEKQRAEALAQRLRTRACRTLRETIAQPMPNDARTALAAKRDVSKSSHKKANQRRKNTPL